MAVDLKRRLLRLAKAVSVGQTAVFVMAAEGMANITPPPEGACVPTFSVSEPTTLLLVGVGFLILAGVGKRKFKK